MSSLTVILLILLLNATTFLGGWWWYRRGGGRMGPKGFPRPNTEWKNTTTGNTFTVSTPSKDLKGEPVNPVVRRGFISVVWPKKTFRDHFK